MYIQWDMEATTQFSIRFEPDLIRQIDDEAEKEYKNRTELIKEAVVHFIREKGEKEKLRQVAAELWLKGEISETSLKKVLNDEEIKDLKFGKSWIEETLHEIRR